MCRHGVPQLSFLLYFAKCKVLGRGRMQREYLFDLPEGELMLMTGTHWPDTAV